jgi:hypothetical protein
LPSRRPLSVASPLARPQKALLAADIIIATPEKWDGISRNWQSRSYVRKVRFPPNRHTPGNQQIIRSSWH